MKKDEKNLVILVGIVLFLIWISNNPVTTYNIFGIGFGGDVLINEETTTCNSYCPTNYEICVSSFGPNSDAYTTTDSCSHPDNQGPCGVTCPLDSINCSWQANCVGYHSPSCNQPSDTPYDVLTGWIDSGEQIICDCGATTGTVGIKAYYSGDVYTSGFGKIIEGGLTGGIWDSSKVMRCLKVGYLSGSYKIVNIENKSYNFDNPRQCKGTPADVEFCLVFDKAYKGYDTYRYVLVAESNDVASGLKSGVSWLKVPITQPPTPSQIDVWSIFNSLFAMIWDALKVLFGWLTI